MDQKKIGMLLKRLRKEKKLTQRQLAERFQVSDRTVSRWETGSNLPDLAILVELADFYEIDVRNLLDGEWDEPLNKNAGNKSAQNYEPEPFVVQEMGVDKETIQEQSKDELVRERISGNRIRKHGSLEDSILVNEIQKEEILGNENRENKTPGNEILGNENQENKIRENDTQDNIIQENESQGNEIQESVYEERRQDANGILEKAANYSSLEKEGIMTKLWNYNLVCVAALFILYIMNFVERKTGTVLADILDIMHYICVDLAFIAVCWNLLYMLIVKRDMGKYRQNKQLKAIISGCKWGLVFFVMGMIVVPFVWGQYIVHEQPPEAPVYFQTGSMTDMGLNEEYPTIECDGRTYLEYGFIGGYYRDMGPAIGYVVDGTENPNWVYELKGISNEDYIAVERKSMMGEVTIWREISTKEELNMEHLERLDNMVWE